MSKSHEHLLVEAREFLGIAEQIDVNPREARRRAYIGAAERIAEYKDKTGCTNVLLASKISADQGTVSRLLKWHKSGYKAATPFLMDEQATGRAALSHTKRTLRERPKEVAADIAEAMEDPEVAQAVTAHASPKALGNVDVAASSESYVRKQQQRRKPPADAASNQLGGVGPAETSQQVHDESMEPMLDRLYHTAKSAENRMERFGFRLALTELGEFNEVRERLIEVGKLVARFLDEVDAAEEVKEANEAEGAPR